MATPIVFEEYKLAVRVEPDTTIEPQHTTIMGKACVCIPLSLQTAPVDARKLPIDAEWSDVSEVDATFLNRVNETFGTTFLLSEFQTPTKGGG